MKRKAPLTKKVTNFPCDACSRGSHHNCVRMGCPCPDEAHTPIIVSTTGERFAGPDMVDRLAKGLTPGQGPGTVPS